MDRIAAFELVKKVLLEILPDLVPSVVQPESKLVDLGANSVDRMDLITSSMEESDISRPLLDFANVTTLQELADVLISVP